MHRRDDHSGSASIYFVVLMPVFLAVAALVIDGGKLLNEWRRAEALANAAARVGAQKIDEGSYFASNKIIINEREARTAIGDYLQPYGATSEIRFVPDVDVEDAPKGGNFVEVTVTLRTNLSVLALAGIGRDTVTGTGQATATSSEEDE